MIVNVYLEFLHSTRDYVYLKINQDTSLIYHTCTSACIVCRSILYVQTMICQLSHLLRVVMHLMVSLHGPQPAAL